MLPFSFVHLLPPPSRHPRRQVRSVSPYFRWGDRLGKVEAFVQGHVARSGWVADCKAPADEPAPSCRCPDPCPRPHQAQAHPSTHLVPVFHLQGNIRGRRLLALLPIDQRGQAAGQEGLGGRWKRRKFLGASLAPWAEGCGPLLPSSRHASTCLLSTQLWAQTGGQRILGAMRSRKAEI